MIRKRKNTANRPSESDREFVINSHGEKVRNMAYNPKNKKTASTTTTTDVMGDFGGGTPPKQHFEVRNDNSPQVWIGCTSCYSNGMLEGRWVEAEDAGDVTPNDIHENGAHESCEGMWCYDSQNIPGGEMSVAQAAAFGDVYEDIGDSDWDAYMTWKNDYDDDEITDDEVDRFYDAYAGTYPSMDDFAYSLLKSTGWAVSNPKLMETYFDYDRFARDLAIDRAAMEEDAVEPPEEDDRTDLEYAYDWVKETNLFEADPETAANYFNHDAFARDLAIEYGVSDTPNGEVHIFYP